MSEIMIMEVKKDEINWKVERKVKIIRKEEIIGKEEGKKERKMVVSVEKDDGEKREKEVRI